MHGEFAAELEYAAAKKEFAAANFKNVSAF
jgi:hypothetical protein